jgi:hypothetical protein
VSTRTGASVGRRSSTAEPRSGPMAAEYQGCSAGHDRGAPTPARSAVRSRPDFLGTLGGHRPRPRKPPRRR